MNERPIAADLLRLTPQPRLLAGRNRATGRIAFPLPADAAAFDTVELPDHGVLWSYTVQRFAPKSPPYRADGVFEPFAVGYVELAGALIVESRLVEVPFAALRIGLPLRLTTFVLRRDAAGPVLMFAFRPFTASAA